MSPLLIETIRIQDGEPCNLEDHCRRMRCSGLEMFGRGGDGASRELREVMEALKKELGADLSCGCWKARVVYGWSVCRYEAGRYRLPVFGSAALMDGGGLDYGHKFADRAGIDSLSYRARDMGADTALIVVNGRLTDFSYANAAFYDGSLWWTPSKPLLRGTARERLIREGKLRLADLVVADLKGFMLCSPVNAMLDLGKLSMPVERIIQTES